MRLKLLIADPDQRYLGALEQYFSANQQERFYLGFFSKQEYLLDYLNKNPQEVDILLVNCDFFTEELKTLGIRKIFLLSEGQVPMETNELPIINKYQPCNTLVAKIMEFFAEGEILSRFSNSDGMQGTQGQESRIFSVYSPVGGVGKTTIAVASATLLAQLGKKVLYLNLEEVSSQSLYLEKQGEHSLSNLFYMTKNRNKNLVLKLQSMVVKDYATQINYIAPLDSPLELEEIEPEDIEYLLTEIQGSSMYDYIIIDLSSNFDSNNIKFMAMSDRVMMLLNHDPIAKIKGEVLWEQMCRTPQVKEEIQDKILWIMNRSKTKESNDLEEEISIGDEDIKFHLPKSRECWVKRGDQLVLNSSSSFAKRLFEVLVNLGI